jgi:3-hydroxyisobutyrate dehydrogenase/glyoxylate/succinic semialdehyde reductase
MQKDMHLATVSAYESGAAVPVTNVAKEIYRLAMRGGHDTEDFSVVYEYLTNASDSAIVDQKSSARAKAQLHQAT